jgi:hypothetical protein
MMYHSILQPLIGDLARRESSPDHSPLEGIMNPFAYLKAVVGAVGANVFPPLADWAVSFIPHVPDNVKTALSILLVALATGGAVYGTPNQAPQRPDPGGK